jgi:hypothetical protein
MAVFLLTRLTRPAGVRVDGPSGVRFDVPVGAKVRKFDTAFQAVRVVVAPAAQYKENLYNRASPEEKQANRPSGEGKAPFGGWRHHLFPVEEVPRSGIGGGERSEPISRMLFITYEAKEKHRAAFPANPYSLVS